MLFMATPSKVATPWDEVRGEGGGGGWAASGGVASRDGVTDASRFFLVLFVCYILY